MIVKIWDGKKNFGDLLNKDLVYQITGIEPVLGTGNVFVKGDSYVLVGSMLTYIDPGTVVWGAGFINIGDKLAHKPRKVCAVRGPLSRKMLIEYGVDCPEVYGDPALLMPKFYKSKVQKKYRLGLVTHWFDTDNFVQNYEKLLKDKTILHVRHDLSTYDFIDQINSCERIVSSSLHGIIIADAYGVPAIQMGFIPANDIQFKFDDYFLSVHRPLVVPVLMSSDVSVDSLLAAFYDYKIDIDLDKLMAVCPFNNKVIISPYSRKLRGTDATNAKNYPYFKEVVEGLKKRGCFVIQIGKSDEVRIDGVDEFLADLSLKQIQVLVEKSTTWISVDNFMQHFCWMLGKKGIAIFGPSDPIVFGHDSNINLFKDRSYLRQDPFFPWEAVKLNVDAFVAPDVVIKAYDYNYMWRED